MIAKNQIEMHSLNEFLTEYKELNKDNKYRPVAVGRYGIRTRESIYSKELASDYSKNKLIHKNTLTVGMGSVQMDIGILTDDVTYSVSPAYHTYKIDGIDCDYLRYCLQQRNMDMFTQYMKRGSRQGKSIDLGRWITYKIPVYPESVQYEIIDRLRKVQLIIESRQQELQKLDELVKARFVEMFGTGNYPKVTIAELVTGKVSSAKKDFSQTETIKYIDISSIDNQRNIMTGYTEYVLSEAPSRAQQHIIKGDIVISTVRPNLRNVAITTLDDKNLVASSGFCVLRAKKCLPSYLMAIACSDEFTDAMSKVVTGANYPAIKDSDVMGYVVSMPPIELQEEFESFSEQVDKSKFAVQKALDEAQLLFDSLMQKYFG